MEKQWNIRWFDETDSTNTQIINDKVLLKDKSAYAALFQSAGRGQRGNKWESKSGENLTFSVLFKPEWIPATEQFVVSQIITLAISDYMLEKGIKVKIKWPNDIYVGDLKICGILMENTIKGDKLAYSVVGIGINLNQKEFCSDAPNPTSIALQTGRVFDTKGELEIVLRHISEYYDTLTQDDFPQIEKRYLDQLYRIGEMHKYIDCTTGKEFSGKIVGIDKTACIEIEDASGKVRSFAFKEIKYVL